MSTNLTTGNTKSAQSDFQELVEDKRYSLLQQKIKIDKSNLQYEINTIPMSSARGSYTITAPNYTGTWGCWNDGSTHYVDVDTGSTKPNLKGCYLQVSYIPVQIRQTGAANTVFAGCPMQSHTEAAVGPPVIVESFGHSIPWNSLTWFKTISLKGNQGFSVIEQYTNPTQMHHITTQRYLLNYKKSALENADQLFTPCLESAFDTRSVMSGESQLRATLWLGSLGAVDAAKETRLQADNNMPKQFSKMIPLSDIFECCSSDAIFNNLYKFRVEFQMTQPDQIAFLCAGALPADTSTVYIIVNDIKLIMDSTRLTDNTMITRAEERINGNIENIGYFQNELISVQYLKADTSQVVASSQKNVQMVTFAIPSLGQSPIEQGCLVGIGVNPIQYWNCNISRINLTYGQEMPFRNPLLIGDNLLKLNNLKNDSMYTSTAAYAFYRKCCSSDLSLNTSVAIPFIKYPMYHIFCFPIYNMSMVHQTLAPRDVRIDISNHLPPNPASNVSAVIMLRKFAGCQIDSKGKIDQFL